MATAATPVRGLSTDQLQTIRDTLAAGRKPKVMFTEAAGQIAGRIGQVVELTEPELTDEWVVVRFGHDELPFAPTDLTLPPRGATRSRGKPTRRDEPVPPDTAPGAPLSPPPMPTPRQESAMPSQNTPAVPPPAAPQPTPPAPGPNGEVKPKRAARTARGKATPSLTVTLAYTDSEWTVAANQGSRALAKPYVIKAAEALKMVALLDVPGVQEAVEHIVAAERTQAEQQADRLRAELAEIEARLAELRDAT